MGPGVIGIDQVANGFSLGEVALCHEERRVWVNSPASGRHPGIDQALHEALGDERAAVNVTFHHIFSRKLAALRRAEEGFIKRCLRHKGAASAPGGHSP